MLNEIPRRRDRQKELLLFQALAIYRLYVDKIEQTTNHTKRHFFE